MASFKNHSEAPHTCLSLSDLNECHFKVFRNCLLYGLHIEGEIFSRGLKIGVDTMAPNCVRQWCRRFVQFWLADVGMCGFRWRLVGHSCSSVLLLSLGNKTMCSYLCSFTSDVLNLFVWLYYCSLFTKTVPDTCVWFGWDLNSARVVHSYSAEWYLETVDV